MFIKETKRYKSIKLEPEKLFVAHNFWNQMMFPYQEYKIELKDQYAIVTKI